MKDVVVSRNYYATVDDDMFEIINSYKWHLIENGYAKYAQNGRGGSSIRMHWLVVGHPIKPYVVDHLDRNGLNNCRNNLRVITQRQNASRTGINRPFPGVYHTAEHKWKVAVRRCGILKHLGIFSTELAAVTAYRSNIKDHGEYLLPEHEEFYYSIGGH